MPSNRSYSTSTAMWRAQQNRYAVRGHFTQVEQSCKKCRAMLEDNVASVSMQNSQVDMQFGLIFFASSDAPQGGDRYRLVIESARFADRHGFSSIWIPERHFTRDG